MPINLHVSFRDVNYFEEAVDVVMKKVKKLLAIDDRIISCNVMIEAPHRHSHKGELYHVRVRLTLPRGEVVAGNEPGDPDLETAIRRAFATARRALLEHKRRERGSWEKRPDSIRRNREVWLEVAS